MDNVQDKVQQSVDCLVQAQSLYGHAIKFSCSFGAEDMVLVDMISKLAQPMACFTLDTGRLPEQTYALMQTCRENYGNMVSVYFPDSAAVEKMVSDAGVNLFYASVEHRKQCCFVRKVMPLQRALQGCQAWVTGLRREQAKSRQHALMVEDDAQFGIKKINPLLDWSEADVWAYIKANDVPYNALHDQFYPSIGCAPCTRAITVGEDIRAGRWWWEQDDVVSECGLHASPIPKVR